MTIVAVANSKGGVGKTTLVTNLAGLFASVGESVALADLDKQQSSSLWLKLRPKNIGKISEWKVKDGEPINFKNECENGVIDTPAGLDGWRLKEILKHCNKLLVPISPSIFDIHAAKLFLDDLSKNLKSRKVEVGLIGMRVDERTNAANQFNNFLSTLNYPVISFLRPTQNYVQLSAHGLSLFDIAPGRVSKDLLQWIPIRQWLFSTDSGKN